MNYWVHYITEVIDMTKLPSLVKSYDPPTHGHNDDAELAAFLAYWFNHDIFECSPKDTIRGEILRIAVQMSRGITYPLAPVLLGVVYRHLDALVSDVEIANSHEHIIESYIPTNFLQMCFWESFLDNRSGPSFDNDPNLSDLI